LLSAFFWPSLPFPPACVPAQGNVKLLMEDVAALRPTLFMAVPRILERVEDGGGWHAVHAVPCCACHAVHAVLCARHPGAALEDAGMLCVM
jgi:hypothetical protein